MEEREIHVTCTIAGAGPAGMMLGFLLARAGVEVMVLEKHEDFFRDFRGDTVHPSTLEIMYELGLLDAFRQCPHQEISQLQGKVGESDIIVADFSKLKVHAPYIAFMPQWDFLSFIAEHANTYPNFQLRMQSEVTDLIEEDGRIAGVVVKTPTGMLRVKSDLVVGTDGRHSIVRERAHLPVQDFGVPIDVFWFRLSRKPSDIDATLGRFAAGKIMVLINREDYWQCGYVIAKGESEEIHERGLPAFRRDIAEITPFPADRTEELKSWDDIKLLTVKVDRLTRWWRTGLLCIGDAAHAMSPIGGVGINLAVQDAVAAANILAKPLRERKVKDKHLQAVQKRRTFPTHMTQRLQLAMQNQVISPLLASAQKLTVPLPLRALQRWPFLRRLTGYIIGMGFRPEHVKPL
jgi:2-polyprenyl-6-methoxyphenol hydroxylase-like FAD-dependent oxidoreductase